MLARPDKSNSSGSSGDNPNPARPVATIFGLLILALLYTGSVLGAFALGYKSGYAEGHNKAIRMDALERPENREQKRQLEEIRRRQSEHRKEKGD